MYTVFFHIEKRQELKDNKEKSVEAIEAFVGYVRHGATNVKHVIKDGSCEIAINKFHIFFANILR